MFYEIKQNQTKSKQNTPMYAFYEIKRNQTKSDEIKRNTKSNPNVTPMYVYEIEAKSKRNQTTKSNPTVSSAAFLKPYGGKPSWFLHWVAGHVRFSCVRCSPSWSLHIVFADVVLCRRPSLQYALWSCSVLVCSLQTSFVVFAHCVCRRCALQNMGCRSCSLADVLRGLCTLCLQTLCFADVLLYNMGCRSCSVLMCSSETSFVVLCKRPSATWVGLGLAVNVVVCSSCSYVLSDVLRALQHEAGPAPSCFLFFWFCTKFS